MRPRPIIRFRGRMFTVTDITGVPRAVFRFYDDAHRFAVWLFEKEGGVCCGKNPNDQT